MHSLTIVINFISSKDNEEGHVMHSNSGNIKIASYSDPNNVFHKRFEPLFTNLLYYKYLRVNIIRGGSCIDSPGWIKKKKVTKNPKKADIFNAHQLLH